MTGYALARLKFFGSKVFFVLMLLTMMLPIHATLISKYIMFNILGWVGTYLPLIVPNFFAVSSFFCFLFVQFMRGIPKELDQAAGILQALGGVGNISSINNCATRLRIALHDMSQTLDDEVFKKLGAHGVFRSGDAIQVIIGLHVSQLREQLDSLINSHQSADNVAITEAV